MNLHIHIHNHPDEETKKSLILIHHKLDKIMTEQEQLAEDMKAVSTQLQKIGNESAQSVAKLAELETQLANQPNLIQPVKDAFAALKQQVQLVDDLVPDAAPAEAPVS